jgi:hypothetical protein
LKLRDGILLCPGIQSSARNKTRREDGIDV